MQVRVFVLWFLMFLFDYEITIFNPIYWPNFQTHNQTHQIFRITECFIVNTIFDSNWKEKLVWNQWFIVLIMVYFTYSNITFRCLLYTNLCTNKYRKFILNYFDIFRCYYTIFREFTSRVSWSYELLMKEYYVVMCWYDETTKYYIVFYHFNNS